MVGVGALRRSSADTTSLATAPRSLTYGVEDDSSHHAAGAVNKTRATAPTATSKFRVTRRRFDAAAFVWAAAAAPASAGNIAKSSAVVDTRSVTAGRLAPAAARPCARYSWSEPRPTSSNERAAAEGSSDSGSDA